MARSVASTHRPLERRLEDENVVANALLAQRSSSGPTDTGGSSEMVEMPRIADNGSRTTDRSTWPTRFEYDARDLLVSIRDAAGRTRHSQYDGIGRVVRIRES